MAEKVLLDTDIGSNIDDAVALAYLLSQPKCELLGVTTVSGPTEERAQLASAVCQAAGRAEVPVHRGCSGCLLVEQRQKDAPQARALGNWAHRRGFTAGTAVEFLRATIRAHPHEVTLLTIGPLTNIACLFTIDPEIPALLKRLVMMCGWYFEASCPEWNALLDPHAAAAVCQARAPECRAVGLDVTRKCTLPKDEFLARFQAPALQPVRDFATVWLERNAEITFHDPLAAAVIFQPELCTWETGRIEVELDDPKRRGFTSFHPDATDRAHLVAKTVNPPCFFQHYFEVVR